MSISQAIKREARYLGFDAVGITSVVPEPPAQGLFDRLQEWLRRGYHGTMAWMARDPDRRAHPQIVLPGCRSIISLGMNYDSGLRAFEGRGHGRIARYAWGKDYHGVLGDRLALLENKVRDLAPERSEERRVGKECRSRWPPY